MSISSETARNNYTGNGTKKTYDYDFFIFADSDLAVKVRNTTTSVETTLTLNVDYEVAGANKFTGRSITLLDADQDWIDSSGFLDSGWVLSIIRDRAFTQPTDIRNQGASYASAVENALDQLVMLCQQLRDKVNRSIRFPDTEDGSTENTELGQASDRDGKFLSFDASGEPILSSGGIDADLTVSSFAETLLDDADQQTARETLGFNGSGGTVQTGDIENGAVTPIKQSTDAKNTNLPPKNLFIDVDSATTADITADEIHVYDSSGNARKLTTVSLTADITNPVGINGLDAGSEASGTWYFIYVIYDGTTTASLLSTSATSPTLPSGYTYSRLVGAVRNDGSSNFIKGNQQGKVFHYDGSQTAVTDTTNRASNQSNISLATVMPSIARIAGARLSLQAIYSSSTNAVLAAQVQPSGFSPASASMTGWIDKENPAINGTIRDSVAVLVNTDESQQVDYYFTVTSSNLTSYSFIIVVNRWEHNLW